MIRLAGIVALVIVGILLLHLQPGPDITPTPTPIPTPTHVHTFAVNLGHNQTSDGDWSSPGFVTQSTLLTVSWILDCSPGSEPQLFFSTRELGLQLTSFERQGRGVEHVARSSLDVQMLHVVFAGWAAVPDPQCTGAISVGDVL